MAPQNRKLRTLEMKRLTADEFREAEKTPLVVVLDDVRSMYNVGSIFRTADAFRLKEVCLCGITGQPPNNEIHKTALGAEDSVAWRYFATASEAVDCLHNEGYKVFAVEQCEGSIMLHELDVLPSEEGIAVVLGNEVKGVHQEVIYQCDGCLEIRQYGTKHSKNVAVTAGIVIWEIFKRIKR